MIPHRPLITRKTTDQLAYEFTARFRRDMTGPGDTPVTLEDVKVALRQRHDPGSVLETIVAEWAAEEVRRGITIIST